MIKASLLNSADDFGNVGPDFQYGWGRVNALRALQMIENVQYLSGTISQGQSQTVQVPVPAGVKEVRIMTYWLDYEWSPIAATALVKDPDMTVSFSGTT